MFNSTLSSSPRTVQVDALFKSTLEQIETVRQIRPKPLPDVSIDIYIDVNVDFDIATILGNLSRRWSEIVIRSSCGETITQAQLWPGFQNLKHSSSWALECSSAQALERLSAHSFEHTSTQVLILSSAQAHKRLRAQALKRSSTRALGARGPVLGRSWA